MTQTYIDEFKEDAFRTSIVKEQLEARDIVFKCLEKDIRCRNDDLWLILNVWKAQGISIIVDYEKLKELFSPETIRRVRQEIQSCHGKEGELLPTDPNVAIKRKIKEEEMKKFYGSNSWIYREFSTRRYDVK